MLNFYNFLPITVRSPIFIKLYNVAFYPCVSYRPRISRPALENLHRIFFSMTLMMGKLGDRYSLHNRYLPTNVLPT
jgi:hypothetical protein